MTYLPADFFLKDALMVAPRLLGCRLAVDGRIAIVRAAIRLVLQIMEPMALP